MKKQNEKTTKASNGCQCGAPLPHHLAEFMNNDVRCSHVCSCGARYKIVDMRFVRDGSQHNPFAS